MERLTTIGLLREHAEEMARRANEPRAFGEDVDADAIFAEAALTLANTVLVLLEEPTNVQALALARLMRDRQEPCHVYPNDPDSFVLAGYWSVTFHESGFECGIAPDGSVSS